MGKKLIVKIADLGEILDVLGDERYEAEQQLHKAFGLVHKMVKTAPEYWENSAGMGKDEARVRR